MSDEPRKKTDPALPGTLPDTEVPSPAPSTENPTLPHVGGSGAPAADPEAVPAELVNHPRYRVVRLLGRGGMGAVYLAEHLLMERQVALKVIGSHLLQNPEMLGRFRQEVRAVASLSHPNIVAAHDADTAGALHFLVMEYIDGVSLADYEARHRPLPVAEACAAIEQAALGLQHAFERGMIHRDIKPQNLMRRADGQVKILDFGLARFSRETGAAADASRTASGVILGTADYISPEQTRGTRAADTRSDIYSLGCTLYHLLAGRAPFIDGSVIDRMLSHTLETPPALASLRPDLPPGLVAVVERMMAKDPARRYQTPAEVVNALAPFAHPGAPHDEDDEVLTVVPLSGDDDTGFSRIERTRRPAYDAADDDGPPQLDVRRPTISVRNAAGLATTSLALGVVALFSALGIGACCFVAGWFGIPLSAGGLVLGVLALANLRPADRSPYIQAAAGIGLNGLALIALLITHVGR
jgi:serine/threonine protein kinase